MPMLKRRATLTRAASLALAGAPAIARAQSDTTVRMLHIETNPQVLAIWQAAAQSFEAKHPGAKVEMRVMEAEAFKARLPTLLQSNSKPHIFYSWGGGLVDTQIKAGMLEDITAHIDEGFATGILPVGLAEYRRNGRQYGLPYLTSEMGLLINRRLFEQAGVAPSEINEWPGFLAAVKKFKAAGIQPIVAGGQDKWHMAIFHSHLALRLGGWQSFADAMEGRNGGFNAEPFVKASEMFREFIALDPYQPGFMAMKAQPASGMFADGKAAMLCHGTWFYRQAPTVAADKKGIPVEQMPFAGFPMVPGGKGTAKEIQGQLNGWLVSKGAPKLAVDFLKHFLGAEPQRALAAGGFIIPVSIAARTGIANPWMRETAERLSKADRLVIALSSLLGAAGGKAQEDAAVGLTTGTMTPKQAAEVIDRGWKQEIVAN